MRRQMQMIFQDPYASLNPRMTVGSIIGEPLEVHNIAQQGRSARNACRSCCSVVGLNPYFVNRYPHEFSGGQRQRIGIARALAVQPELHRLRRADLGAGRVDPGADHQPAGGPAGRVRADLPVHRPRPVRGAPHLRPRRGDVPGQDRGAADRDELYENPLHPYTQALLSAVPIPDPVVEEKRQAHHPWKGMCPARQSAQGLPFAPAARR